MEDRSFYVYAHYRLDTMEPFYIGKGKGNRKDILSRNTIHDNISKKHGHAVVILYDNLTEEEAFFYEREVIEDLVFNEGYEIHCKNCGEFTRKFSYLTNFTLGGEGKTGNIHSEEYKKKISIAIKKHYEDEKEREKMSVISKKRFEDPKEREKVSKTQRKRFQDPKLREKMSIINKKRFEDPKERKKCSQPGENNKASKYHKVIINNKIIIGRYLDETINMSKQYIDNINRNWFKKSVGIPKKFKNIVSIEEISREDYYILLQNKNIISYVNDCNKKERT